MSRDSARIVHVITDLDVGGAEMMLYKLVKAMDRERYQPSVISLINDGPIAQKIQGLHIPVRSVGMSPGTPDLGAIFRLRNLISSLEPDIIQTWMYHADLIGSISARLAGMGPVVWGIRHTSLSGEGLKSSTRWVARASALISGHMPAKIVCASEATRKAHSQFGYSLQKMQVIRNGFDSRDYPPLGSERDQIRAEVRDELGIKESTVAFGTIGRFHPIKDLPSMLAAFGRSAKDRDARLVLVGRGLSSDNPQLVSEIEGADLSGQVILLGQRDDIPRVLTALDVFVNSSYSEAFSNAIGEAMLSSLPCIVTDVGDSAWILGGNGAVVPPADVPQLADAMKEYLSMSPDEMNAQGQGARGRAESEFSIAATAHKYMELYDSTLDQSS